LNGSNSGISRSEASCLNYAKGYARGSRVLRDEASCLNYAKSYARGSSSLEKIND